MEVKIDPHTLSRADERGASLGEIELVLENGIDKLVKEGRYCKWKVFVFRRERKGKYYEQKKIEVLFCKRRKCNHYSYCLRFLRKIRIKMIIHYNSKTDLLYLRFDPVKQDVINKQVSDDVTLDIGANDKIIGIEILDASKKVDLNDLLPLDYELRKAS